MPVKFTELPFTEAQDFLRQKVSLPTKTWKDIQDGMHARAFVIAGAQKTELLSDIRESLQKALDDGKTLADFKKDFRGTVQKHGWNYNGKEGWRTAVIFNTNMRSAFSAGNEQQLQRTKSRRPYARYIAGLSAEPRQEHLAWHNIILPIDHSWWSTHTPPNGWGCKCRKVSVSSRELERNNWKVSKSPPTPPSSIRGIDEGFNFNPGRAAWGQKPSEKAAQQFGDEKKLKVLSSGDWESAGRPEVVPLDKAKSKTDERIPSSKSGMEAALKKILGGDEKIFSFDESKFRHDFNVNASILAKSLSDTADRARFLPLLPETVSDPYEIWQTFEQNKVTGKVVLRTRFIKNIATEKDGRGSVLVADTVQGQQVALTFFPSSGGEFNRKLNKKRIGKLIWKRKEYAQASS